MTLVKSVLTGSMLLTGTALVANAQIQYTGYPYGYQAYSYHAPAAPRSWSYDPYTSGLGPCPQWLPGDLETCGQRMPPTYGQPSYWSR